MRDGNSEQVRSKKGLYKSFLKGFAVVLLLLALWTLMQGSSDSVEVYPEISGYWDTTYNWTIDGSVSPQAEKLSLIKNNIVAVNFTVTKGPPVDQRGFNGRIIVANNSGEAVYIESIKLEVGNKDDQKISSQKIVAIGDTLAAGGRKAYHIGASELPGKSSYFARVQTLTRQGSKNKKFSSIVDIEIPGFPTIINGRIKLRGPGLAATRGLAVEYESYSRTFSENATDRQIFKLKPFYRSDFYLSFDYVIDETEQRLSLIKKITP